MSTLKLQQSGAETVSAQVIKKLYQAVTDSNYVYHDTDLQGILNVPSCYLTHYTYLTTKYPNLTINVSGSYYIEFLDSVVESILATNFGDGSGITAALANALSSLNIKFRGNTQITSFNEFSLFSGITTMLNSGFEGCTNLVSIDLSNITEVGNIYDENSYWGHSFKGCSNLESIGICNNLTKIHTYSFESCNKLTNPNINWSNITHIGKNALPYTLVIDVSLLTNLQYLGDSAFSGYDSLKTTVTGTINMPNLTTIGNIACNAWNITAVEDLGTITTLPGSLSVQHGVFRACSNLRNVVLPSTLATIDGCPFIMCGNLQWVKCLATTPPTLQTSYKNGRNGDLGWGCPVYVPDASVATYKAAQYWSDFPLINDLDAIRPLSLFATDFPSA